MVHNIMAAVDKDCHGEEADLATDGVGRRSIPSAAGQDGQLLLSRLFGAR